MAVGGRYGTGLVQIAPRPFGQLLADAMNALARVWRPLLGTASIVFLPIGIMTLLAFQLTGATEFLDLVFNDPDYLAALGAEEFLDEARPFLQATAIALGLQALGTLFVYAAMAHLVAVDTAGFRATGAEARRFAARRIPTLLVAGFVALAILAFVAGVGIFVWSIPAAVVGTPNLTSVLIAISLLALLVGPGLWLAVSMSMFVPVAMTEPVGPLRALRRSFRLVRGRWWPTFAFLLLVGLLGFVAVQLIQLVAIPLALVGDLGLGLSLTSAVGILAQGVIIAGYGAMYAAWYIDLRARSEPLSTEELS